MKLEKYQQSLLLFSICVSACLTMRSVAEEPESVRANEPTEIRSLATETAKDDTPERLSSLRSVDDSSSETKISTNPIIPQFGKIGYESALHTTSDSSSDKTDTQQSKTLTANASPPEQESQSLGEPNGILSSRPSEPSSENNTSTDDLFSWSPLQGGGILQTLCALAVVIGIILLLRICLTKWLGPFRGLNRPSGVLEVLARYPAGRNQQYVLLKLGRRILLLHQAGTTTVTLANISGSDEVASLLTKVEAGQNQKSRFGVELSRASDDYRQTTETDTNETVDLTRSQGSGLSRLLKGKAKTT